MKRIGAFVFVVLVMALLLGLTIGAVPRAKAAAGLDCSFYDYQEDAQRELDAAGSAIASSLDLDGDGVACNELPARPPELRGAELGIGGSAVGTYTMRAAGFDRFLVVRLAGLTATPAGTTSAPVRCPSFDTQAAVSAFFQKVKRIYVVREPSIPEQPVEYTQDVKVTGYVWVVEDDPAQPVLVNEVLLRDGDGAAGVASLTPAMAVRLQAAQNAAISEQRGIWGPCTGKPAPPAAPTQPPGTLLSWSGHGSQVSSNFTVTTPGVYQLTLKTDSDRLTFAVVEVYTAAGQGIPALGVSSAEPGSTSANATYLDAGAYFLKVTAAGEWSVTVVQRGQ